MQSENIGKLALALSKAQGQMDGASKSAENPFFKNKYADLHECILAAKKPLSDNELAVIQTTETVEKRIMIITTLAHSSGEWVRGTIEMTPKKDDDQGRGSSITYGRRYAYAAIIGLSQKDDDGNGSCGDGGAKKQTSKPLPKKLSGDWIKIFDKEKLTSVPAIRNWRAVNTSEILATVKDKVESTKLKKYLDEMEKEYTEPPKGISCPNNADMVTEEDCKNSKCSSTYEKCAETQQDTGG